MQQDPDAINLWKEALIPFKNPATNKYYLPEDTFDTRALGFKYDTLPKQRPKQLKTLPDFCLFKSVNMLALNKMSYQISVFLVPKDKADEFKCPPPEEWEGSEFYAGNGAIFGGKGVECENCKTRKPFDVSIDVSGRLRALRLSRHEVEVVCMTEDQFGEMRPLLSSIAFVSPYSTYFLSVCLSVSLSLPLSISPSLPLFSFCTEQTASPVFPFHAFAADVQARSCPWTRRLCPSRGW